MWFKKKQEEEIKKEDIFKEVFILEIGFSKEARIPTKNLIFKKLEDAIKKRDQLVMMCNQGKFFNEVINGINLTINPKYVTHFEIDFVKDFLIGMKDLKTGKVTYFEEGKDGQV